MAFGNPAYSQTVITAQANGPALSGSTSATSLLPTPAVYTIPANAFSYIGQQLKVRAQGIITTAASTPGTLTLALYLAGSSWCASQAMSLATSLTNSTWEAEFLVTIRALGNGTNANAMFIGKSFGITGATSFVMIPATSPAVSSGFNSVQANALDFFATFSSSATNAMTLEQYEVIAPN